MTANASTTWDAIADASSGGVAIGDPMTLSSNGQTMVLATTANLAASPSGVVECVAIAPANPSNSFVGLVSGRLSPSQAPFVGVAALLANNPYAIVNSVGRIVRSPTMTDATVGICGKDGSVTLSLEQYGGFLGGGNQPQPTLTAVDPPGGWRPGSGLSVRLTGTNFTVDSIASFGGLQAISTTFINATTLTAVTPTLPGAGLYAVAVTNPGVPPATMPNAYRVYLSLHWRRGDMSVAPAVNGSPIDSWGDESGNATHATQTAGARPTYIQAGVSGISGQPTVAFGAGKSMVIASNLVTANSSYTVITVGRNVAGALFTVRKSITYSCSLAWAVPAFGYLVHSDGFNNSSNIQIADAAAETASPTIPFVTIHAYKGGALVPLFYINGTSRAIIPPNQTQATEGGTAGCIVYSNAPSGQDAGGECAEQIVVSGIPDATMLAFIDAYVTSRYPTVP